MFSSLASLLTGKSDTLVVTLAIEDNAGPDNTARLRVNLHPKFGTTNKDAKPVLERPISLVATAAELDGPDFIAGLQKVQGANETVKESLDKAEDDRKKAAEESKAAAAASRPAVKSTTVYPKKPEDTKPAPPKEDKPKDGLVTASLL
jgi:PRTRC genetic system protein E